MSGRSLFIGLFLSIFIFVGDLTANTPLSFDSAVKFATRAMNGQVDSAVMSAQMSANCSVTKACTTQCGLCGFVAYPLSIYRHQNKRVEIDVRSDHRAGGFGLRIFRPPKEEQILVT